MNTVHGEAGDIVRQQRLPVHLCPIDQRRHGVHDGPVDDEGDDAAEHRQSAPAAAQPALAEQHSGQKADDAHAEHLEGCPRPLGKEDVAGQHGHGPHQKARLTAEGHPGDDGQGHNGLELGQHEEGRPARHAQGAQHGDDGQLTGLWSTL